MKPNRIRLGGCILVLAALSGGCGASSSSMDGTDCCVPTWASWLEEITSVLKGDCGIASRSPRGDRSGRPAGTASEGWIQRLLGSELPPVTYGGGAYFLLSDESGGATIQLELGMTKDDVDHATRAAGVRLSIPAENVWKIGLAYLHFQYGRLCDVAVANP